MKGTSFQCLNVNVSDARLIQEIKKHSTLYDPKIRGYTNQPQKEMAWELVASKLGIHALDAKSRWRNVRDRYVREKKRLQNDGEHIYRLRDPWPLLEDMSFLWDFITHRKPDKCNNGTSADEPAVPKKRRKTHESKLKSILPRPDQDDLIQTSDRTILPHPEPEWVNVTLDYDNIDESLPSPAGIDPSCILIEEENQTMFKREPDDVQQGSQLRRLLEDGVSESEELHPLMTSVDDSQEMKHDTTTKDEDVLYCLSVAASLKRFTPKMKAIAKCKIQQVMFDVEFNESGPNSSQGFVLLPQ